VVQYRGGFHLVRGGTWRMSFLPSPCALVSDQPLPILALMYARQYAKKDLGSGVIASLLLRYAVLTEHGSRGGGHIICPRYSVSCWSFWHPYSNASGFDQDLLLQS